MNPLQVATDPIYQHLHEPFASLLIAITYGQSIRSLPNVSNWVLISGCAHMIVLSGTNITILIAIVDAGIKKLALRMRLIIICLFIFLFMALVGPEPPLVRAVIMAVLTALANYYGLVPYPLWNLFLAVLLMGMMRQQWLSSVSLHLSVLATLGIMASSYTTRTKQLPWLLAVFVESVFAQLFTLPVVYMTFRSLSLVSPLTTLLLSWTIAPLMITGMVIPILHYLFPPLADVIAIIAEGLLIYLYYVLRFFGSLTSVYITF